MIVPMRFLTNLLWPKEVLDGGNGYLVLSLPPISLSWLMELCLVSFRHPVAFIREVLSPHYIIIVMDALIYLIFAGWRGGLHKGFEISKE